MLNNQSVAELCAGILKTKFQKSLSFLEDYNGFMKSIIEKGYTVKVPTEQLDCNDNVVHTSPCGIPPKEKTQFE